jgi:hypothetical protein
MIKSTKQWADNRVTIELDNGVKFDVHIDENNKVSLLCNTPHKIADNREVVQTDGYYKGKAMNQYVVTAEYFGHPFED